MLRKSGYQSPNAMACGTALKFPSQNRSGKQSRSQQNRESNLSSGQVLRKLHNRSTSRGEESRDAEWKLRVCAVDTLIGRGVHFHKSFLAKKNKARLSSGPAQDRM